MTCSEIKRRLSAALVALVLLWAPAVHAAVPANWKDTGFSINATGMTLRQVMEEFGRAYGVRVAISTKADIYMRGRLKADSGSEFLDRLTQPYKFRWFVYNETLYVVSRDENASLRLEIGEDAVQDAKAALLGLGLFDTRFGWGELPDEGTVIVSGPRAYVNLVRDVLLPEETKAQRKGKQVMIFRLKYATATDRVITLRDQSETIPGVKTILSNLLFANRDGEKTQDRSGFDVGSSKRSRKANLGKGEARDAGGNPVEPKIQTVRPGEEQGGERSSRSKSKEKEEPPRIEADPSLNAIIIYDNINKRDMYKALIAELDVEPQQIEIEALIVDIDRNKLSDLGVEWGVRSGDTVGTMNSTKAESKGVDLPIPGSTLLITNAARFYTRLRALESSGQARVLAKPTVLTLNNVAAVLDLSQTQFVPLVGERTADLANITAGTSLRVVPRIVREGENTRVRLEVDIEDGTLGDPTAQRANVTRSTISTQALIDLHQTLMIGGYHSESISKNQQKTPLLGDVPLVGNLFRTDTETHTTKERLFLITPRLAPMSGVAASAQSRASRLAKKIATVEAETSAAAPETGSIASRPAGGNDAIATPIVTMPPPETGPGYSASAANGVQVVPSAWPGAYGARETLPDPNADAALPVLRWPGPRRDDALPVLPAPRLRREESLPVLPWPRHEDTLPVPLWPPGLDDSRHGALPPPLPVRRCARPKGTPLTPSLSF
jgi:type III secretion protein C